MFKMWESCELWWSKITDKCEGDYRRNRLVKNAVLQNSNRPFKYIYKIYVTKHLFVEQKQNRLKILVRVCRKDSNLCQNFLDKLITGDESWVLYYNPETNGKVSNGTWKILLIQWKQFPDENNDFHFSLAVNFYVQDR